jgi:hypothetical protein
VAMVGLLCLLFFLWLCAIKEKILARKLSNWLEKNVNYLIKWASLNKELEGLEPSF